MKKLIVSTLALFMVVSLFSQNNDNPKARKATEELTKMYNLDEDQSAQLLTIEQRKQRNLAEIASLEQTDKKLYRHKRRAIQQSTDASMRRMLNKDQMEVYKQRQREQRENRAAKIAELKDQGHTMEEIEDALLDLEEH